MDGDLSQAFYRKEPELAVGSTYREATRAWATCANNETIAYLRLRAAELGAGKIFGHGPRPNLDWRQLVLEIGPHFPGSARITTIAARASGSIKTARAAVALDRTYIPAHVALAQAQVKTGDPLAAVATLKAAGNLATVCDGFTVLARARLDAGDITGAIRAVDKALHHREFSLLEPDANDPRPRAEATAILGLAYLKLGKRRQAARALFDAADLSETARETIAHADPALQRELNRLRSRRRN